MRPIKTPKPTVPPPDPGLGPQPHLHTMGSEEFENFCLEIARQRIKGVQNADLFELRGNKQYGVDFYLDCGPNNLIVGSCKAHESPSRRVIVNEAAGEFIKHWPTYWKQKGVKKFILCLAADSRPSHRQTSIKKAKEKVRALGIECEVWAKRELIAYCTPYSDIVRRYLGASWVFELCESLQSMVSEPSRRQHLALTSLLEAQKSSQTPLLNHELERLNELLLSEDLQSASDIAKNLKADDTLWNHAEPKQRAQILRTLAATQIDTDLDSASALYEEATQIYPPSDRFFKALIAARRIGPQAGLVIVSDPRTARERGMKAALTIEVGEPMGALEILGPLGEAADDGSDLNRLQAIALMMTGRAEEAIEASKRAVDINPRFLNARIVHAIAHYAASLAPAAGLPGLTWPQPYPSLYVRSALSAKKRRAEALTLFEEVCRQTSSATRKAEIGVWKFAAIADDPHRRGEAKDFIKASLEDGSFHPGLVVWALARRLPFDKTKARRALLNAAKLGDPEAALATVMYLIEQKQFDQARAVLEEQSDCLKALGHDTVVRWTRELELASGEAQPNRSEAEFLIGQRANPGLEELRAFLSDESHPAFLRYEAASILAAKDAWAEIWAERGLLINDIGTADSFVLAAFAAANVLPAREALEFVDSQVERFIGDGPPDQLKRLRVHLLASSGDMLSALSEVSRVSDDPKSEGFLAKAEIETQLGNLRGAVQTVWTAVRAGNPALQQPHQLLRYASIFRREDPSVSKALMGKAQNLNKSAGTEHEMESIFESASENTDDPGKETVKAKRSTSEPIRIGSAAEFREWMIRKEEEHHRRVELYEQGEVNSHAVFGDAMGFAFLSPFLPTGIPYNPTPRICHAVNGAPAETEFSSLLMDTTSVLVAEVLGLWPKLYSATFEVFLPQGWAPALLAMELASAPSRPDLIEVKEKLVSFVQKGLLKTSGKKWEDAACVGYDFDSDGVSQSFSTIKRCLLSDTSKCESDLMKKPILVAPQVAEELIIDRLLEKLCGVSETFIEEGYIVSVRKELRHADAGLAVADQLKRLREQLSNSVMAGDIKVAAAPSAELDPPPEQSSAVERVLWSLLHISEEEGQVISVDDRLVNGHQTMGGTKVVGFQSVLQRLVADGQLSATDQQCCLDRLRKAGFSYLQPTSEELVGLLIEKHQGSEAAEEALRIARKSFAGLAWSHNSILQNANGLGQPEHDAVYGAYLLASHVVRALISDDSLESKHAARLMAPVCQAFSLDWRDEVYGEKRREGAEQVFVTWHASLLAACFELPVLLKEDGVQRAADALESLCRNLIKPATSSDREIENEIYRYVGKTVAGSLRIEDLNDRQLIVAAASRYVDAMPSDMRETVLENKELVSAIGIIDAISFGDYVALRADFWDSIESLFKEQKRTRLRAKDVNLVLSVDGDAVLVETEGREGVRLQFTAPGVIGSSPNECTAAFDEFLCAVEFESRDRGKFLAMFSKESSVEKRQMIAEEVLQDTVEGKLYFLSQLEPGDNVSVSQMLPPSLDQLSSWMGFENLTIDKPRLAFRRLADELGYEKAYLRWMGVPIGPTQEVVDWFSALSKTKAEIVGKGFAAAAVTAVSRRNVINLLSERSDTAKIADDVKNQLSQSVVEGCGSLIKLAEGSLSGLLDENPGRETEHHLLILSWAWAELLCRVIVKANVPRDDLASWFSQESRLGCFDQVGRLRIHDALNPFKVSAVQLAGCALSSIDQKAFDAFPEDTRKALVECLSFKGHPQFPALPLLALARRRNAARSWLVGLPIWLDGALSTDDKFVRAALEAPRSVIDNQLSSKDPDPAAYGVLGVDDFSDEEANVLLQQARKGVQAASLQRVLQWAAATGDLTLSTECMKEERRITFKEIAIRLSSLFEAQTSDDQGALVVISSALGADIRDNADWWKNAENTVRDFVSVWTGVYEEELCQAIDFLLEVLPVRFRPVFRKLQAEVLATPDRGPIDD